MQKNVIFTKLSNLELLTTYTWSFQRTHYWTHKIQDVEDPPQPKFCKNRLRGIPLLGKFIPKTTNFGDFGGCKPTF